LFDGFQPAMRLQLETPAGTFTPGTPFWRVNREWLVGLAGSRAVLLELAHPIIAEGVARHSNYRGDPFGRLYRTLRTMTDLTFADARTARRAARHFHTCHQAVTGALTAGVGPFEAGTPYDANDPFLKLWVLATLIDSVMRVFDLFVAPLSLDDRESYYRDAQVLASWLGLSPALMPAGYDGFVAYMDAMLTSDLLTVGEPARDIVAALYGAPLFGPFARRASFVGIGLLPAHLREAFSLRWTERDARWLSRLAGASRRVRPWLPDWVMVHHVALRAEQRARAAARSQSAMAQR
jgi:uncharacterized protein (DUF2236 family)